MSEATRDTPLYDRHVRLGARMVPFAGYRMPVQYQGIKAEHLAVRTRAGMFDVSHMGEVWFEGPKALEHVHWLATNNIRGLADGQVAYTPLCKEDGTIVDDCLIYRASAERLLIVVNAANHDKDVAHFQRHLPASGVRMTDRSYETGEIALQGPKAAEVLAKAGGPDFAGLKPFTFKEGPFLGEACLISRTGYTGEDGFEIYTPNPHTPVVWDALMQAGKPLGISPAGLGARDTLRLEARLCLYGNDIDETTTPLEAGLAWTVKFDVGDFLGKAALERQKAQGVPRKLIGLKMVGRGIARHGYPVVLPDGKPTDKPIGHVTSGTTSPTLDINIGLAYLPAEHTKKGSRIGIVIRENVVAAEVIPTPFYKRPG